MTTLLQDIRYALRSFRRNIGFTTAAVLTLALGIGATTVVYSVVDHVVLRPLDFPNVDRLVVARLFIKEMSDTYPTVPAGAMHFDAWRRDCSVCDGMAAIKPRDMTLTGVGNAERVGAVRASATLFPLLGVRPELGRFFSSSEDAPGQHVAVISDALWRRRFGADPSVIGRNVTLDDASYRVIGVAPADFRLPKDHELGDLVKLPSSTDVFVPLGLTPYELASPGAFDYAVIARLRAGVTLDQARTQLDGIERGLAQRLPNGMTIDVALTSLQQQVVGTSGRGLILLLVAVGAMLLLVCINISILLLARNANRVRESAIRIALGARRTRLVRMVLTESVMLALSGGLLGVGLSYWGLAALVAVAPASLPRVGEVHIDGVVLAMAFIVSTLAGVVFGVLPAIRYGASDPGELMKGGGRTTTDGTHVRRSRAMLIATQVAVSTILLVTTGLFISSFARVMGVDRGFNAARLLAIDVVLPRSDSTSTQRLLFYQAAMDRLRAIPGVTSTAITDGLPLTGDSRVNTVSAEHDQRPESERPLANIRSVSPEYFATMATPIQSGRTFSATDRGTSVVVVSERVASAMWPGENPIGKRLIAGDNAPPSDVIGVVADVPTTSLEQKGSLVIYRPISDWAPISGSILVRTTMEPSTVQGAARAALRQIDPAVPISSVRSMSQIVSGAVAQRRFEVVLLALFALTSLVTGCIGIYGTTAYTVGRRMNEIGIRMVLGARSGDIYRLVLRQALTPVGLGLGVGLLASLMVGRTFASMLYDVHPGDPTTLVTVILLLGVVTTIAAFLPGRRAVTIDPIASLRLE